jgi:hypothetical protein
LETGSNNAENKAPVPAIIYDRHSYEFDSFSKNMELLTKRSVRDELSSELLHVNVYSFGSGDNSNDRVTSEVL